MPIKKRVIQVPFESIIVDDDFNCRKEYTEIDALAKSIYDDGLLQPVGVAVRPQNDGVDKYFLVYGFRRYRAIEKLRKDHGDDYYSQLEVVINEGNLEDLRVRNLRENIERKSLSSYEISQQVKRMVLAGFDQKDIAFRLGRNQSWVSYHYKAATQLSVPAQNALKQGDITMEHAMYLADVPEEEQKQVLEQVLSADSRAEAKQLLKDASNESGKRRKYANRGRPSAKNLIEMVAEMSFQAESEQYTKAERTFFNGVAAGLRVALGDAEVDPKGLDETQKYSDPNYHKRDAKPAAEATVEASAEDDLYDYPTATVPDDDDEPAPVLESRVETEEDEEYAPFKPIEPEVVQTIKGVHESATPKKRGRKPKKQPTSTP